MPRRDTQDARSEDGYQNRLRHWVLARLGIDASSRCESPGWNSLWMITGMESARSNALRHFLGEYK